MYGADGGVNVKESVNLDINEAMPLLFYDNGYFRYEALRVTFSIFGVGVRLKCHEFRNVLNVEDWMLCCKLDMMSCWRKIISE